MYTYTHDKMEDTISRDLIILVSALLLIYISLNWK